LALVYHFVNGDAGCLVHVAGPYFGFQSYVELCKMPPSSLVDPLTCGEDLLQNAARISELAPDNCVGCADYHIRSAAHRCAPVPKGIGFDRPELITLVKQILAEKTDTAGSIGILIPGSADTGILATAAHAATMLGQAVLDRCRFTVIDRCPTPLILCREFGARHPLEVHTVQSDLVTTSHRFEADIILVHSVFRFIEQSDQVQFLNKLGSWLTAIGRLIISNRLRLDAAQETESEFRKRTAANLAINERLAAGALATRESPQTVLERLQRAMLDGEGRPGEFQSLEDVRTLIAQSQLEEVSLKQLSWNVEINPGNSFMRHRAHAVLRCRR
jgi:hypothetical protein